MNVKDKKLPYNIDWSSILYNLKKQTLVLFLGAGTFLGFNGFTGLPSGDEFFFGRVKEIKETVETVLNIYYDISEHHDKSWCLPKNNWNNTTIYCLSGIGGVCRVNW